MTTQKIVRQPKSITQKARNDAMAHIQDQLHGAADAAAERVAHEGFFSSQQGSQANSKGLTNKR